MSYDPGDILKWNDNTKDKRLFMIIGSYTYPGDVRGDKKHLRYKIRMLNDLEHDTNFSYDMIHRNCSLVQKGKRS